MVYINTDELLTPASAAEELNCTRAYIYKLVKEGKIAPTLIDEVIFVRRADLPTIAQLLKTSLKGKGKSKKL